MGTIDWYYNKSPLRLLDCKRTASGAKVEMFYVDFGKGKSRTVRWEFFRDDEPAGYAVNANEAKANWILVKADYILNSSTGRYESAS